MKLLTASIRAQLPALYTQEKTPDPIAYVKFFMPGSNWTWYATEFDQHDTFFGLVQGTDEELGYFSLGELQLVRNRFGLGVERDLSFTPTPLSHLRRNQNNQTPAVSTNEDGIIVYDFTDADSEAPTDFFNFIIQLLGDD